MSSVLTKLCTTCLALTALGTAVQAGTFKTKPADKDTLLKSQLAMGNGYVNHQGKTATLPDLGVTLHEPLSGQTYIARKRFPVLLFKTEKTKKEHDRLVLDLNADGKLTKEEVLDVAKLDTPFTVKLSDTDKQEFFGTIKTTKHARGAYTQIQLFPTKWLEGTVKIDGKDLRAALLDVSRDGKPNLGDALLIDVNGDGKFDGTTPMRGLTPAEMFLMSNCMVVDGKLFVPTCKTEGECQIELAPFKGTTGALKTSGTMLKEMKDPKLLIYLQPAKMVRGKNSTAQMISGRMQFAQKLPTGSFKLAYGILYDEKMMVMFSGTKALEIKENAEIELNLNKPEYVVTAKQKGRNVVVNRKSKPGGNVRYRMMQAVNTDKPTTPVPPKVEIFVKGGDGKAVASGKLEYGWGGLCDCSVSIPKTVEKGKTLIIRVSEKMANGDTIKTEKEHVFNPPATIGREEIKPVPFKR